MAVSPALTAQTAAPAPASPTSVQWWQGAAVLGGIAVSSAFDHAVQVWTQENRSASSNDIAAIVRRMGQPEVFATVPLGMIGVGLLGDRLALRQAGERVTASVLTAGVLVTGVKFLVGRVRPSQTPEPYHFKPLSRSDAFPSGHTTMAFALAAALGEEIGHPWWARAGLFGAAAATGWSRLNDNMHWLSDVVAGAALGVASAEVMEGRWTVFHIHAPTFATSRTSAGFRWVISLPLP